MPTKTAALREGPPGVGRKYRLLRAGLRRSIARTAKGSSRLGAAFALQVGQTLGIFAGSMMNAAALAATLDAIS